MRYFRAYSKFIRQILCICQAKTIDLCTETFGYAIFFVFYTRFREAVARFWRDARVVEEARLESVYTPKGYHEFESRSLRIIFLHFNINERLF